ncbi:dephospho-CoA kinase [Arsenicicoccus dermatophilus]|uniref:dephospho-CoA kinase n=1 Tax=Arsenicicoccus dermatophilus TaxID=1076331 RepID=UPI001F4CEDDA|nr:dephospho-CoA kinase [Arsenicicoccus dermatophilus]MCH8613084.1 dephospho-CoA kinase [Arsenicicoccus dermatophilus]
MLRIGLTGGIGSGKSTVSRRLTELGAAVVDADLVAREVVAPGSPGLQAVADRFGAAVVRADGTLDRAALGAVVFDDERARRDLEAITHPLIAARTEALMGQAGPDAIVVHDVPLLVEKHLGPAYHLVLVVDTPAETRVGRLVEQRGMTVGEARARMAHQATDEQRRVAADVLLDNSGSTQELTDQVDRLWRDRIQPYADNLRTRTRARRADVPTLVDYDDTWPEQAQRLIERISHGMGALAPEIEHIGSTAVPGLAGKDVVDLQIGVADLRDADAPEFLERMEALGFPRSTGNTMDQVKDEVPDPSMWVKRFHGTCDPGRIVHVHVRETEGAGWQYALLYRDWLRGDATAREDYLAEKRRLAGSCETTDAYAVAKEPWFNAVWPRMQAWAQRTSWHS